MDEINRVVSEVLDTFVPIFFKSCAIAEAKRVGGAPAAAASGSKWQLLTPPMQAEPLLEGWATKLGEVKQNWKRRYFVAMNEADNFRIDYYAKEEHKHDPSKRKGTIYPCGYYVKALTHDTERAEFGDGALTIKPLHRGRQWFLRCDSEAECDRWCETIEYCCNHARAELSSDPVMREAFERAYQLTRWRLGMWGAFTYDGPEEWMLAKLIVGRCNAGCMVSVYEKIPGGRMESKIKGQVDDMLDQTVAAAVGSVWRAAVDNIEEQRPDLEAVARRDLSGLNETEKELMTELRGAIHRPIQSHLVELTAPIMTPLLNALGAPLVAAFKELVLLFHARVSDIVKEGPGSHCERALAEFTRDIRYPSGSLRAALHHLYSAFRDDYDHPGPDDAKVHGKPAVPLSEVLDMLHGVQPWRIEERFERWLRRTACKAIFTVSQMVEEAGDASVAAREATMCLIADSRNSVVEAIKEVMRWVLVPPFQRNTDPVISTSIGRVGKLVPRSYAVFLDVSHMAADVRKEEVDRVIADAVTDLAGELLAPLDTLPVDVGAV